MRSRDRTYLKFVALGKTDQVFEPGHGSVIIHDLTDDSRRIQARHANEIHAGFGMTRSDQNAAGLGPQRKDMAWLNEILFRGFGIHELADRAGAVMGRNPRRHAILGIDGRGPSGSKGVLRLDTGHHADPEFFQPFRRHGDTDIPPAVTGHEVDLGRIGGIGPPSRDRPRFRGLHRRPRLRVAPS